MTARELDHELLVLRRVERAGGLVLEHRRERLRAELAPQPVHLGVGERDARAGVRQHEPGDVLRVVERVLECEAAAPRLAEQVDAAELEPRAHLLELVDEPLHRPRVAVVGPVGGAAAELVVEDDAQPVGGELTDPAQVVAGDARAAVQYEQRLVAAAV